MDLLTDKAELINTITKAGLGYGTKFLTALVVLFVGFWVIKKVVNLIELGFKKKSLDASLSLYLGKIIKMLFQICLIISVASMVGIQTTSFIAVLGAAGLAIGMALQGSLSNFAGGFLILLLRPFKVGDYIVADGMEGFVEVIDVFCTRIKTLDNRRVILPNGPLAGNKIINVGAEPTRRVDLSIGISYGDDYTKAKDVLLAMAKGDSRVLSDPAPFVGITDFGDSSVNLAVRVWCKTADYWDVFFDSNQRLKESLDQNGISIPFPQREVNIISEK